PFLRELLAWSLAVNELIEHKVKRIPPFSWAAKSLELMQNKSHLMVVSQTPLDALVREWDANNILDQVQFIAGQEIGTKSEHLAMATQGKYAPSRVIMIGDAAGDRVAAEASGAWFYPIKPGQEDDSWKRFHDETYGRFLNGSFDPAYQQKLNAEFDALLPENPPWQTTES
ncbi:MAG: HAD family hydrolase, partial [Kiritimatiellae bacterium]|nr:HAD family hydrolase [Kiritimatiellia bacterium]